MPKKTFQITYHFGWLKVSLLNQLPYFYPSGFLFVSIKVDRQSSASHQKQGHSHATLTHWNDERADKTPKKQVNVWLSSWVDEDNPRETWLGDRRLWSSKTNGKESIEGLVVQILGLSVASKIRVFLSPGFRNEGFMIDIRRTDNAFTGLLQSRQRAEDILTSAVLPYNNKPSHVLNVTETWSSLHSDILHPPFTFSLSLCIHGRIGKARVIYI